MTYWNLTDRFSLTPIVTRTILRPMVTHVLHRIRMREGSMNIVRALRLTASFALFGAVVAGIVAAGFGAHSLGFDLRWIGAAAGAVAAVAVQVVQAVQSV